MTAMILGELGADAVYSEHPCDTCGANWRWSPTNFLCGYVRCPGTTEKSANEAATRPTPERSPHQNVMLGLPTDPEERKRTPILSGVLDYFPAALAEVARVSLDGNEQHNPGQPLHWARGKSSDQADCIVRHLLQRGTIDERGMRHSARLAWRALALLQEELEAEAGFDPLAEQVHQEWTEEREEAYRQVNNEANRRLANEMTKHELGGER